MERTWTLKSLSFNSLPGALAKAERYRLLNEPAEAESICRDILDVDPDNQAALVTLVLALSDEIPQQSRAFHAAMAEVPRLSSPYERAYYEGILWERRAKARYLEGNSGAAHTAHEWLTRAMTCFEAAERLRTPGNDDAILRWNTCVRFLNAHPDVVASPEESHEALMLE